MTLAEHLAEVRHRFLVCAITGVVARSAGLIFYPTSSTSSKSRTARHETPPQGLPVPGDEPLDGLTLRIKIGFFGGLLAGSPVIFWQLCASSLPSEARERKYAIPFVACSVTFFVAAWPWRYSASPRHPVPRVNRGKTLLTEYNPNQYLSLFLLMMFIFASRSSSPSSSSPWSSSVS